MDMKVTYEFHPFSDIWPLLEGKDFDDLAYDIAANGLHLPITLYDGLILDGRNRYKACMEAGVNPVFIDADAKDDEAALELVFSLNQHRRHLSFEHRAFAAARYANMKSGTRTDLLSIDNRSEDPALGHGSRSIRDAAHKFHVAPGSVSRARTVIRHGGPELEKKVKEKKVGLASAAATVQPHRKTKGKIDQKRGLSAAARVPVIDTSKRRLLSPEQVDPEFKGTPLDFARKYGHVQVETAEERASNRFAEWTLHIRKWAREYKEVPLSSIDVDWLRSPKQKDVERFLEAYATLALVFDNIQDIKAKAEELRK